MHRPLRNEHGDVVRWCISLNDINDRKQLADGLRDAEQAWRSVINGIPGHIATLSPSGGIEFVNRQILEYTGCSLDELRKWDTNGIVHPDDLPAAAEIFGRLASDGKPYEIELRLRRFDGTYRWFSNRGTPAYDESGNLLRWYVLFVDIDRAKRAEEALRESEERLRLIVDNVPAGIAIFEPTGEITEANRQLLDYFGQPIAVVRQWPHNDLGHPDDLPTVKQAFWGMVASGEPGSFTVRLKRFDGTYRWFEVRNEPLRDHDGAITRWYGVITDVDDRKRVENAVAASERELRETLNTISAGIVVVSPDSYLEGANRQLLEYFGEPMDEVRRWTSNDIVHPDDREKTIASFREWLEGGKESQFETRLRRFDGVYRWFQVRNRGLRDADGNVVRWYGLLTDIEDLKRAEEALAAKERETRLLVNTIPGLIATFAPDGNVREINDRFLDYLGQTLEEFVDWPTNGTVHPEDVDKHVRTLSRAFEAGDPIDTEARLRRFDGTYRWFQVRGLPVRNANGKIEQWYCLMSDIDDRKKAEEAVAANESSLKTTVDTIPALAWSARPDGTADFFNKAYLEYVGRTPEELEGWAWTSTLHPDDLPQFDAAWQRARESGGGAECEARLLGSDGKYRWFIFRANPLRDSSGSVVKWYGINTDIEDRKRAEEAVNELRTELAHVARLESRLVR